LGYSSYIIPIFWGIPLPEMIFYPFIYSFNTKHPKYTEKIGFLLIITVSYKTSSIHYAHIYRHMINKTLRDQFIILREKYQLTPDKLDPRTAYVISTWGCFTYTELGFLFGCSPTAISNKVAKGEKIYKREGIKANLRIMGESLQELNASDIYTNVIKTLAEIANPLDEKQGLRPQDMIRACEALGRLTEPKVIEELQIKFELLNGLIRFILADLIPETDKRVRQTIKDIQDKVAKGEEMGQLQFSLRLVMKELLPKADKLYNTLVEGGWIKADE